MGNLVEKKAGKKAGRKVRRKAGKKVGHTLTPAEKVYMRSMNAWVRVQVEQLKQLDTIIAGNKAEIAHHRAIIKHLKEQRRHDLKILHLGVRDYVRWCERNEVPLPRALPKG
jgi:hypothetical protein